MPASLVLWQAHLHWIALNVPRAKRNALRHPSLHLLPLLALPALARWGPAATDVTEYRWLSSSSCNALPAVACDKSSCVRALPLLESRLSAAPTIILSNIPHFMRRSIFYPLAFRRTSCPFLLPSYIDCACYTTPICLFTHLVATASGVQSPLA